MYGNIFLTPSCVAPCSLFLSPPPHPQDPQKKVFTFYIQFQLTIRVCPHPNSNDRWHRSVEIHNSSGMISYWDKPACTTAGWNCVYLSSIGAIRDKKTRWLHAHSIVATGNPSYPLCSHLPGVDVISLWMLSLLFFHLSIQYNTIQLY